jgi:hypothetical protein
VPVFRARKPRHAEPSRRRPATTIVTGTVMVLALDLAGASTASAHGCQSSGGLAPGPAASTLLECRTPA